MHGRLRAPFPQPPPLLVAASAEFRSDAGPATHRFKDGDAECGDKSDVFRPPVQQWVNLKRRELRR